MADSSVDDDDASPKLCAHQERVGRLVRMCPIRHSRTHTGRLAHSYSYSTPIPTKIPIAIPTKILTPIPIAIPSDEKAIRQKGFTGA